MGVVEPFAEVTDNTAWAVGPQLLVGRKCQDGKGITEQTLPRLVYRHSTPFSADQPVIHPT